MDVGIVTPSSWARLSLTKNARVITSTCNRKVDIDEMVSKVEQLARLTGQISAPTPGK